MTAPTALAPYDPATDGPYDPEKHGRVRVFTGVCATARSEGCVDGYNGAPSSGPNARVRKYHGLARRVYIEGYREYARLGTDHTQQIGLF